MKALIKQMEGVAGQWLPLPSPLDERIVAWAALHGWDASDETCQRLLVCQALFNAVMQQTVPGLERNVFATPLDSLGVQATPALIAAIYKAAEQTYLAFNFWGELYSALIPQSRRRHLGQFWTNEQIAEWMVAWLLQADPRYLVDVGCGAGNFMLKASQLLQKTQQATRLYGFDQSPLLLNVTLAAFLTKRWDRQPVLPTLTVQDYLEARLPANADAVICNPPYTRHHHIAPELKDRLQAFFKTQFHLDVSRQATLAAHFLLKLVAEMPAGARAAVIAPMEVLDARYGRTVKRVLCQHTTLTAIVHFSPQMNAFHQVDVGAAILLFGKGYIKQNPVCHLTLDTLPTTRELLTCLKTPDKCDPTFGSLVVRSQDDLPETPKWLSIAASPAIGDDWEKSGLVVPLKTLARIVRGIATGANKFFVLPTDQVRQYSLEPYVVRTLQRNRDIQDLVFDEGRWQALADEGKGVWLLYLNGDDGDEHSQLRDYLAEGEAQGYHLRSLVQTRKKWYHMEQREIPPIFFTILTRGNPRFILNQAGVRPLNMFSLIYPNPYVLKADAVELLWALLNSRFSLSRLHSVSRTYGGSTLKVEPRELDNLPVINPLALSDDAKHKINNWMGDFYRHRQASVLMEQVNDLVETLLAAGTVTGDSALPVQLRLLETQ